MIYDGFHPKPPAAPEPWAICRHCQMEAREHALPDAKCLYVPTIYEAAQCGYCKHYLAYGDWMKAENYLTGETLILHPTCGTTDEL